MKGTIRPGRHEPHGVRYEWISNPLSCDDAPQDLKDAHEAKIQALCDIHHPVVDRMDAAESLRRWRLYDKMKAMCRSGVSYKAIRVRFLPAEGELDPANLFKSYTRIEKEGRRPDMAVLRQRARGVA